MRVAILPVMAVLTVVAGAVGLAVGDGAIGQIDPIHFQGAAPKPRDVTQIPRPAQAPGYAQASGWAEGYAAREADCGSDCPAYLVRQSREIAPASQPYREARLEPGWQAASAPAPMVVEAQPPLQQADAAPSRLNRYLHYPVTQDQAAIARSVAAERAAAPTTSRTLPPEEPAGL